MKEWQRQLLILFSIMIFLSAITIFWVETSKTDTQENATNNSSEIISVNITKREGDDLLSQSINGLILLHEDIVTGYEVILGNRSFLGNEQPNQTDS